MSDYTDREMHKLLDFLLTQELKKHKLGTTTNSLSTLLASASRLLFGENGITRISGSTVVISSLELVRFAQFVVAVTKAEMASNSTNSVVDCFYKSCILACRFLLFDSVEPTFRRETENNFLEKFIRISEFKAFQDLLLGQPESELGITKIFTLVSAASDLFLQMQFKL